VNVSRKGANIILAWDRGDPEDVEKAESFFAELTRQGWLAARRENKLQRVLTFKPEYGELWFIPLSEGG